MLIGARNINGYDCTMYQVSANRIEVMYYTNQMHTMAFIGKCDNAHIDAIWIEVADNVPALVKGI